MDHKPGDVASKRSRPWPEELHWCGEARSWIRGAPGWHYRREMQDQSLLDELRGRAEVGRKLEREMGSRAGFLSTL